MSEGGRTDTPAQAGENGSEGDRRPLLVIVGPTASGKTALSIALAKRLNGEVVCGDSMQIYSEFQVGTARPTKEEMEGIPHHLFGVIPPRQPYSVAQYTADAHEAIRQIGSRGRLPILCGGTGLYITAVVNNIVYATMPADTVLRETLSRRCEVEGGEALLEELRRIDPVTAGRLHPNDHGRIVRALEIYLSTGRTLTHWNQASRQTPSPYRCAILLLDFADRQRLYDRINQRVETMLRDGLLEEARMWQELPKDATAAQAIGYKELSPYWEGTMSLEEAVAGVKQATRRYAKRQLSWFRHMPDVHRLLVDEFSQAAALEEAAAGIAQEVLGLWEDEAGG